MKTKMPTSENTLRTRILSRVRKLGTAGISVGGSLTCIRRKCGKRTCRCATDREARHEAFLLTWKEGGRTRCAYVPTDMIDEVSAWVQERRKTKLLLAEMDELAVALLKNHTAARRARRGGTRRRG
jgi:hypothetical protein